MYFLPNGKLTLYCSEPSKSIKMVPLLINKPQHVCTSWVWSRCISGGFRVSSLCSWQALPGGELLNYMEPTSCTSSFNIPPAFAKASAGKAGPLQRGNQETFIFFLLTFVLRFPTFDTVFRFVLKTYQYVSKDICQCRNRYRCRDSDH